MAQSRLQFGQLGAAKILLEFGADLEAKTPFNRTPLHLAAAQGHVELAKQTHRPAHQKVRLHAIWLENTIMAKLIVFSRPLAANK